ncbi:MAG: DUF4381 domain-containing protein [Pseudomonadota bacterium]|nr:DUF4381 domain-containing protein [Pseudomonadota bacterium]
MMVDLSGLRDIHIPTEPSWWPPAIGWWIVFGSIILTLLIGLCIFLTWYNQPRQYALRELKKLYVLSSDTVLFARQISVLLKRIVLICYPHTKAVTLTDAKWANFLTEKTGTSFSDLQLNLLIEAPYMPEKSLSADNSDALYRSTQQAIIQLFKGKTNGTKSTKHS